MRKYRLSKPTHHLTDGRTVFAEMRCGKGSLAIRLLSTGEVQRSASFLADSDVLMGHWYNPLGYLFGYTVADAIPRDARLEPIA